MISNRPKRLPGVSYVGYQRYSLTSCTALRLPVFLDVALADRSILQLRQSAAAHDFALAAYCVMPDHVHALAYGTSERSDFRAFVVHFKKLTGYDHSRRTGRRLWQPGYHERILRDDQSTEAVAKYILENPVRGGLASRIGEYRFAGSDLFDIRQV